MGHEQQYELLEQLGAGGMAEVFRARVVSRWRLFGMGARGRRHVAVKRLFAGARPEMRTALLREAELGRELAHPRIVEVLDSYVEPEGRVCLVMELVEGMDLARVMEAAPVPVSAAVYAVRTVLEGLVHVHEVAELVHRDVTPHNVLVSWDGDVKLSDFGIAKRALAEPTSGGVRGKLHYLSPEQMLRMPTDGRADLFAVGVLLYRLVTGRPPLGASSEAEIIAHRTSGRPIESPREVGADIPAALDAVIVKLLAFRRDERYASAREVIDALDAVDALPGQEGRAALAEVMRGLRERRDDESAEAGVEEAASRRRWVRGAVAAVAVVCLAGVGIGGAWWASTDGSASEDASVQASADDDQPLTDALPKREALPEHVEPADPALAERLEPPAENPGPAPSEWLEATGPPPAERQDAEQIHSMPTADDAKRAHNRVTGVQRIAVAPPEIAPVASLDAIMSPVQPSAPVGTHAASADTARTAKNDAGGASALIEHPCQVRGLDPKFLIGCDRPTPSHRAHPARDSDSVITRPERKVRHR